jgi:hypothetical protein
LAYEIVKVFSDNEENELLESVNLSFDHVERVLAFSKFLNIDCEDAEDLWSYLQAKLDDMSYYACLSLPLIRQLLEPSTKFIYSDVEDKNRIVWLDLKQPPQPKEFLMLTEKQREIASNAWSLACRMTELDRRYLLLSSAKELNYWSRYYLECSASLIMLASRLSTL